MADDPKSEDGGGEDTASITETDYDLEEVSALKAPSADVLLGSKSLGSPPQPKALLRLQGGAITEKLADLLEIKARPAMRGLNREPIPVVLGPYLVTDIEKLVTQRHLQGKDCVLLPSDRWKTLREVFPNALPREAHDEVTETYTESLVGQQTESKDVSNEAEAEDEPGNLELESLEDGAPPPEISATSKGAESPAEEREESEEGPLRHLAGGGPALDLDEPAGEEPKSEAPRVPTLRVPAKKSAKPVRAVTPAVKPARQSAATAPTSRPASPSSLTWFWLVLIAAAAGGGAYYYVQKRARDARSIAESLPAPLAPAPGSPEAATNAAHATDWPESVRPRRLEDLYAEDPPLVRKIRPLLIAYESGSTALSSADERTLLEAASPGGASFDARRLAANQLAVLYLANSRIDQAKRTLAPMMESADSDPVTLINAALLELGNGEYGQAWDYATTALRVASPAEAWIAHSVVGLISGYRGMTDQAEAGFRDALRASPANPFVYGLFLRFLSDRAGNRDKVAKVLEEALWSDPDRLLDSPIRAPVAGHVLSAFAFEGLLKAAESSEVKLSEGKKAFVRWLEARYRRNPVSQPIAAVTQVLSTELDPQSQVLNAYLLQEQGKLDQAAEILTRVVPSLGSGPTSVGSWPWSFAADVQYARNNLSQALLLYHNALNRNPQDVGAVLGLALIFREKGEYTQSQQKFSEARALDPLFIPAFLRMSRFDWHRGYRAQ